MLWQDEIFPVESKDSSVVNLRLYFSKYNLRTSYIIVLLCAFQYLVCRTLPQTHHLRISWDWAHESECLTSLTDDSTAHCILRITNLRHPALGKHVLKNEKHDGQTAVSGKLDILCEAQKAGCMVGARMHGVLDSTECGWLQNKDCFHEGLMFPFKVKEARLSAVCLSLFLLPFHSLPVLWPFHQHIFH